MKSRGSRLSAYIIIIISQDTAQHGCQGIQMSSVLSVLELAYFPAET
jgi:hypothetical protein